MKLGTLFEKFDLFADAPDAVAKMRELVLQLAVQGNLVEQRAKELSARECIGKANKPLVEVAPDESIETPSGWVALPLGCLIAANTGGGTPSKQNPSYWNGPIPWASVKDVQSEKYLTSTIDSITEEGLKGSSSNLIPPNRLIVVTRMGLGKLAINTIPVAINQDLRAIDPTTALDLDFAYLLFKSLKMVGSGVTVKGITVDKLHAMPVLLPPLAEQKRIVAKVDELMALCDRLEAQQQERATRHAALARASLARFTHAPTPANLQFLFHPSYTIPPADLRKSILTLAVQGKLVPQDPNDEAAVSSCDEQIEDVPHDIPSNWRWVWLAELAQFINGDRSKNYPSKSYRVAEGVPFINAGHLSNGDVSLADMDYITEEHFDRLGGGKVQRGDVLYCLRGSLGKSAIVSSITRGAIASSLLIVRPRGMILASLLHAYLISPLGGLMIAKYDNGSAQPNLSAANVKKYLVPLPPLAEQRRIVAKVDELMALVDELESQLTASRATAANLLTALVAELTGAPVSS